MPGDERGHVDILGRYLGWRAALSWNRSDFYDLFGPTKRSRKGYAAKLGYDWLLIYDEPRRLEADLRRRLLRPDRHAADGAERRDDLHPARHRRGRAFTTRTSGARSARSTTRRALAWSLVYTGNEPLERPAPQLRGNLDSASRCRFRNSSVWLRTAGGIADGAHNPTLANFYFGGFGNNYVDDGSIKRYREYYSLPGFGIDEISGLNFVKELVEWNLPPVVFESVGTPGFYLTWLRPSLFAAGLWTEPTNASLRKNYTSLGAQVDLRFTVLHWYDMTLSVGFCRRLSGLAEGRHRVDDLAQDHVGAN